MTKAPTSRNTTTFDSAHHSVHLPKPRHSPFLCSLIQFLATTTQRPATTSWATQEGNALIPTGDTNGTTAVGSCQRGTIPPPDVVKRLQIDGKQNLASRQGVF
ncbi:hypothetical protein BDN72DRAFT_648343 [Pluteus cervinus]|uniref:Uncharacterized protein n=1 Tax=Pluteus cervinus TaxID=181527 RepID=A0ACD3ATH9_9AGAR|nr:hypothetical protein BDN72DRAFT_648343 [Pluteus cervinus]